MRFWMSIRAAERGDALQGFRMQRFAVVQTPAQVLQRHLAVHVLEHVEHAARRRIEGRVLADGQPCSTMNFTTAVRFFSITPAGGTG